MTVDETNPQIPVQQPMQPMSSRPVHFTIKDWGILAGIIAMAFGGLFWVIRTEVRPVAQDLAHHVKVDDNRDSGQSQDIKDLRGEHKTFIEQMHKLDVKIEKLAPQYRVDRLPPDLRAPDKPPR